MKSPHRSCTATFVVLLLAWLTASVVLAQTGSTGTITGRAFNPATGEYVRNAEIRLQGSPQIVTTENDGSFRLVAVPAGPPTITVTPTGYDRANEPISFSASQVPSP